MSDQQGNQTAADAGKGEEDAKADKPSLVSKPLFWIVLIGVVAAIAIGGTLYYLHARQFESTDDAFVDAHIVRIAPEVAGTLIAVADLDNRHVTAGQLLAIVPDTMWVTANFKETQLKNMRIGQPVAIKVDAYPDIEFKGRVDSIQR